jgi:GNAT superfamily N-acetyltransferase
MALWDIYLTPSAWRRGAISWLSGQERELAEALITPLWDTREKLWLDQRYLYCHVIAVSPKYQRRGVGQLLMEYGVNIAQKTELPIYIESSLVGMRLYEKMGCQRIKAPSVLKREKSHESGTSLKDSDVALFVWFPKGEERLFPKTIELA